MYFFLISLCFFLFVLIFDFVLRQPFFYRCHLPFFINFLSCFTIFHVLFIFFFFPPFISNYLFLLSFLLVHKLILSVTISLISKIFHQLHLRIWSHFIWDYQGKKRKHIHIWINANLQCWPNLKLLNVIKIFHFLPLVQRTTKVTKIFSGYLIGCHFLVTLRDVC